MGLKLFFSFPFLGDLGVLAVPNPSHSCRLSQYNRLPEASPPRDFVFKLQFAHYEFFCMDGDVTRILRAAGAGTQLPSEELLPLVYEELRGLATARMAGAGGQTLQPTALVHEAWLRLAGHSDRNWNDRAHFFRAAAQAMRCILVDRARSTAEPCRLRTSSLSPMARLARCSLRGPARTSVLRRFQVAVETRRERHRST